MVELGAGHQIGELKPVTTAQQIVECGACGCVQVLEPIPPGEIAKCERCRLVLERRKPDSRNRTLALALAALLLYIPANLAPILRAEYLGARTQTKLFDGIEALFQKGNYVVGGLVFTTSILAPGLKLVALCVLCLSTRLHHWQRSRTFVFKALQLLAPWAMLPVTLLALAVALAELGQVATVHPGPGVFAYAGMVALATWAGYTFDKQIVWENISVGEH